MELILPIKFEHLRDEPSDDKYWVRNYKNVAGWSLVKRKEKLEIIMNELFCTDSSCLTIYKNFDIIYSFVFHAEEIGPENQDLLIDMLSASLNSLVGLSNVKFESVFDLKNSLKMYVLLLSQCFAKIKPPNSSKPFLKALKAIKLAVQNLMKIVYQSGKPEDRMIELIIDIVFAEIEKGQREEIVEIMQWVGDNAREEIWEGWRARAVNLLFGEQQAVIGPISSIVRSRPILASELLRTLAKAVLEQDQINDTQGIKNVGCFIEKLSASLPREVFENLSVLSNLLDCEAYSLRNSIVIAVGEILCFLIKADQAENTEKMTARDYIQQLLELLENRVLDKSSYCRSKVLDVFITLNKENLLPRHWFLRVLNIATSRLHDCTVLVRKKSCVLLECLIYENKLLEGGIKVESKAAIEEQFENSRVRLESLQRASDGQIDENLADVEPDDINNMYVTEQIRHSFLKEYLEMLKLLEHGSSVLKELLKSKNSSDISGAIDGLVACNLRGITTAYDAAASMLSLI